MSWSSGSDSAGSLLTDVVATLGALGIATLLVGAFQGPARVLAAVAVVVVFPGYALSTLLFPASGRGQDSGTVDITGPLDRAAVSGVERAGLSLVLSLFLASFVGLALDAAGFPLTVFPALVALDAVAIVFLLAGAVRRARVSDTHRYVLPLRALAPGRVSGRTTFDTALNVGIVAVVLLSTSMLGYALAAPQDGVTYTDARLLTETPSGEYVAADYEAYDPDERGTYVLALENHEGRTVDYTAVVQLQLVVDEGEDLQVVSTSRLGTLEATVPDGETRHLEHEISPRMQGERLRLTYFVYRGEPPENPTAESAYRQLHIWITVSNE